MDINILSGVGITTKKIKAMAQKANKGSNRYQVMDLKRMGEDLIKDLKFEEGTPDKDIRIKKVPCTENVADILTKANGSSEYVRLLKKVGMSPLRKPVRPSNRLLQERGRAFPPNFLHESWRDFLYWDTELDT